MNSPDNFCYIYGEIRFVSQKQNLSAVVKKTYNLYYGCKEGNQDKLAATYMLQYLRNIAK